MARTGAGIHLLQEQGDKQFSPENLAMQNQALN